ncbi:hypothetical protein KAU15_02285 [candidate division WOR-3 bacterium]|nr:hypothetical protein [candidate division WOR-3 bacterium]
MKKLLSLTLMAFLLIICAASIMADDFDTDEIKELVEAKVTIEQKFNNDITLVEDSIYSDDLITIGGNLDVRGIVDGDVVGIGALVYINGHITGDLVLIGSSGRIDSNTIVDGEFVSIGSFVDMHDSVSLSGPVVSINWGPFNKLAGLRYNVSKIEQGFTIASLISSIAKFISIFLLGCLVLLLFKKFSRCEDTIINNPLRTFLIGIFSEILFIPAIIVLTISIIGIPFIPVFILIVFLGIFIGAIIIMQIIGKFILKEFKKTDKHFSMNLFIGFAVLSIFPFFAKLSGWIGIEWLETIFGIIAFIQWYIVVTYAMGMMVLTKFGTRTYIHNNKKDKVPAPIE